MRSLNKLQQQTRTNGHLSFSPANRHIKNGGSYLFVLGNFPIMIISLAEAGGSSTVPPFLLRAALMGVRSGAEGLWGWGLTHGKAG